MKESVRLFVALTEELAPLFGTRFAQAMDVAMRVDFDWIQSETQSLGAEFFERPLWPFGPPREPEESPWLQNVGRARPEH
jgi:hypothetical protein